MSKAPPPPLPPAPPDACPICHGDGELLQIDEEVGCQVRVPCWRCAAATPDVDSKA